MMSFFKHAVLATCLPWLVVAAAYKDAVIVELDGSVPLNAEAVVSQARNALNDAGLGCTVSQRYQFTHPLFQGASMEISCISDKASQKSIFSTLQPITGVQKVWPVYSLEPRANKRTVPGDWNVAYRQRSIEHDLTLASSLQPRESVEDKTLAAHIDTGVSRLHAANLTGSGIRVAVIDSGFDTSVVGLSKTEISYTFDSADHDNDVRDNCSYHGTHVLGIIGAKGGEAKYGVKGVAPDATYELYRIQGCDDRSARTDATISAFLEAAGRGVDIITCSYGGGDAWPEDAWSAVATRIFRNGTFVSLPAGNDGPGIFSGSTPGQSDDITSVGSADNSVTPYYTWEGNWTAGDESGVFRFIPGSPFNFPPNNNLTVWASDAPAADGCQQLPDRSKLPDDLSNVIFLASWTECYLDHTGQSTYLQNEFGFPYTLNYTTSTWNVADGPPFVEFPNEPKMKGAAGTDFATASRLIEAMKKHGSVQLSFANEVSIANEQLTFENNNLTGQLSSEYTGWGPSLRALSMPVLLAPGGNILSTMPERMGSWGVLGGTSMSTPFTAGVAALVKQKHPDYSPYDLQAVIATTARPVKWTDFHGNTEDFLAPTFQQGGGFIDAWNAVHSTTLLSAAYLSFNDTANRPKELTFSIKNTGTKPVTYRLNHRGASSGYVLQKAGGYSFTGAEVYPVYAEISISPSTVSIEAGASAKISVSITKEPALPDAATRVSHFSGYVMIEAEGSENVNKLSLPYTAFGAPLTTLPAINRDSSYLSAFNYTDEASVRAEPGRVYTCTLNSSAPTLATFPDNIYPGIQLILFKQSREVLLTIINAETRKQLLVSMDTNSDDTWDYKTWYWDGFDANSTFVPAGTYVWHAEVLRLNGFRERREDWDVYETGNWTLRYAANGTLPTS